MPLPLHAHIHAHSTHRSWRSDAHVLLTVHYKTSHWLSIRVIRCPLADCSVGLVYHGLHYSSPGINKPIVHLKDGKSCILCQLLFLFFRRVRVLAHCCYPHCVKYGHRWKGPGFLLNEWMPCHHGLYSKRAGQLDLLILLHLHCLILILLLYHLSPNR